MNVKRILLTGDDSYKGLGLRLLIAMLRNEYELAIAATLNQQSGVGGKMDLFSVKTWGEETVDGIPAVWLDGSPVDTIEFAQSYFHEKFDLVISGINWGANIGFALTSSGTFAAGVRAVGAGLAPKGIIMSWHTPPDTFMKNHSLDEDASAFLPYPGKVAKEMVELCINEDFWEKTFVNINFPMTQSSEYKITQPAKNITGFYRYPCILDREKRTFCYPHEAFPEEQDKTRDLSLDTGTVNEGFISISPLEYLGQ